MPTQFGMAVSALKPLQAQNTQNGAGMSSGGAEMSENLLYQSKFRSRINQESQIVSNASQINGVSSNYNQTQLQ